MHTKTALVVDDSRVARMTLARLLQSHGFQVVESDSGEAALQYLQQAEAKPGVVFMDVMMGGIDGLSATRQIKATHGLESLPVVVCTGNDTEADRDKALATGAMAVLSKPPAADAVNDIVSELASLALAQAETAPSAASSQFKIDPQALTQSVMQDVEQQLLPQLQQQVRHIAEDISRQIAADAAESALAAQSQSLIPGWAQQVTESAHNMLSEIKNTVIQQADSVAGQAAEKAVNSAIEQYGLAEKVMSLLHAEGSNWLKQQQQSLHSELLAQLRTELEPMINRYLEANLTQKITPIINSNVQETLTNLAEQQQAQVETLQHHIKQQRFLNIGAIVVAALALIIAVL